MIFDFLGNKKRAVVSMCHMGALPGSPLYDSDGGIDKLIEDALSDIHKLQDGGVDAIMFGNENDRPYLLQATPESIAAYTAIVQACKPALSVPFGVNYLWDPTASVAIAVAILGSRSSMTTKRASSPPLPVSTCQASSGPTGPAPHNRLAIAAARAKKTATGSGGTRARDASVR